MDVGRQDVNQELDMACVSGLCHHHAHSLGSAAMSPELGKSICYGVEASSQPATFGHPGEPGRGIQAKLT